MQFSTNFTQLLTCKIIIAALRYFKRESSFIPNSPLVSPTLRGFFRSEVKEGATPPGGGGGGDGSDVP